jgi:hypothetical protein
MLSLCIGTTALLSSGRFLNRVQVENFASSKLEVNKFIPIKFATCIASSQLELDLRTALSFPKILMPRQDSNLNFLGPNDYRSRLVKHQLEEGVVLLLQVRLLARAAVVGAGDDPVTV